jgi:putative ABC transport system permease protein
MLAVIGVYAIISSRVRERFAEIGVRLALGASSSDIRTMVMTEGLRFVTLGVAIGVVIALTAGRLIQNLWFGVGDFDMLTLASAAALLIAACAVACYLPARRAMRIEPATLLRTS